MKYFFILAPLILFFSACASNKPLDRTESQKRYEAQESKNQEQSMQRSEVWTKIKALHSQILSIDSQIQNQENLIKKWRAMPEVASSEAMISNAELRKENLLLERGALLKEKQEWCEEREVNTKSIKECGNLR